jgi:8-oxo-dGTP pyrophosphatase MutT (NUDIX family)
MVTLERLEAVLGKPWPVREVALLTDHLRPPVLTTSRESAVLIPMFHGLGGELRVVLTRRSAQLRSHRHEVAFPGGRRDDGESLLATALREAWEEIALAPASVRVLGELEPLSTVKNPSAITPIVGFVEDLRVETFDELRPSPSEVERIFHVGLLDLIHPDCYREERWPFPDGSFSVHFFEVPGDTVWGATGRMVHRLLDLLMPADASSCP